MDTLTLIEGAETALRRARYTACAAERDQHMDDAAAMLREARAGLLDEINAAHGAPWARELNRKEMEKANAQ